MKTTTHLSKTEIKLLMALADYHALTGDQAAPAAGFARGSKHGYASLKKLRDKGFVKMQESDLIGVHALWHLDELGRRFLRSYGITYDTKVHHKLGPIGTQTAHRIDVTWLLIALAESEYRVIQTRNEWQLSRIPTKVKLADGTTYGYSPDSWIHLEHEGQEYSLAVEIDRGTEHESVWRKKVAAMVAFTSKTDKGTYPFSETFGVDRLRFAIAVTSSRRSIQPFEVRAKTLLVWTQLELKKLGKEKWADLFYIRPIEVEAITAHDFLETAAWVQPFSTTYVPLIGGTK